MADRAFTDVQFMSAQEKRQVFNAWVRFVKGGFKFTQFSKALYTHLINHCSFIAHYDRGGFFAEYFEDPRSTQRFLDQFDRSEGCISVEYGDCGWVRGGNSVCAEYYDLNNAMVDVLEPLLPGIREKVGATELAVAKDQLQAAQSRVAMLEGA